VGAAQVIDEKWRDHLYDLDHLKASIGFRGWGQKDPLIEYKQEAYSMFVDLMNDLRRTSRDAGVPRAPQAPRPQPVAAAQAGAVRTERHTVHAAAGGPGRDSSARRATATRWRAAFGGARPVREPAMAGQPTPAAVLRNVQTNRGERRRRPSRPPRRKRSAATTRARAARGRSTRSATAPGWCRKPSMSTARAIAHQGMADRGPPA
jgi:preprotein translocase subunit SecA